MAGDTTCVAAIGPYSWKFISSSTRDGSVSVGEVGAVMPKLRTGEYSGH